MTHLPTGINKNQIVGNEEFNEIKPYYSAGNKATFDYGKTEIASFGADKFPFNP
jgi:hypothetical protein